VNARLFERLGAAAGCEVVAARSDPPVPMPRVSIARMAACFGWSPADSLELAAARVEEARACSS